MSTRERTIVYALLGILAAINLLYIAGSFERHAIADGLPTFDTLGPTDAVAIRPSGEGAGDAASIEVRNHGERISWGESAHARAYSVGFVHVGKPMTGLLTSDLYQERREELTAELDTVNREKREALIAMMEELRGMDQDDPAFQQKLTEAQQLDMEYQEWLAEARSRSEGLEARLIAEAYGELTAAVEVIAEKRGVDLVYRFIPDGEPFEPRDRNEAQLYIRGRTLLAYPDGVDLTDAIMQELALANN